MGAEAWALKGEVVYITKTTEDRNENKVRGTAARNSLECPQASGRPRDAGSRREKSGSFGARGSYRRTIRAASGLARGAAAAAGTWTRAQECRGHNRRDSRRQSIALYEAFTLLCYTAQSFL